MFYCIFAKMKYKITAPKKMKAEVTLPASKSISNRALIIRALCKENFIIKNLSDCDDTQIITEALNAKKKDSPQTIDIGNCGTAMRFLTAYFAIQEGEFILTGNERMKCRPIGELVSALQSLGADIKYMGKTGFPPLKISGRKLDGGMVEISGNISSQFVSALLLIAPVLKNGISIKLSDEIASKPYIGTTIWLMKEFGIETEWTESNILIVKPQKYVPHDIIIEKDWSAASYWYEIVALSEDPDAEVVLKGMNRNSAQGDKIIIDIFKSLNVSSKFVGSDLIIKKTGKSPICEKPISFRDCPDIAPTLMATCKALGIRPRFNGLENLQYKESDRLAAMEEELKKISGSCDALSFHSHNDHRIAMSLAPLSLCGHTLSIDDVDVVKKSHPSFWQDLRRAGFDIVDFVQ